MEKNYKITKKTDILDVNKMIFYLKVLAISNIIFMFLWK